MEGPMFSSSLGAMGSLLGKLRSLLVSAQDEDHQVPELDPQKEKLELLKQDLEAINTFLVNLSWVEAPNMMVKHWMNEVRDLSYDIEDYIDRTMHPRGPNSREESRSDSEVEELSTLVKQAKDAHERHNSYDLGRWASNPRSVLDGQGRVPRLNGDRSGGVPRFPGSANPQPAPAVASESGKTASLPKPFISRTYELVDDPAVDDVISWNDNGSGFIVWRPLEFARDLLPKYFKHNNFSSFVRLLNTYGFRKIVPDRWEFVNDYFRRGEKPLLCHIHRRMAMPAAASATTAAAAIPMDLPVDQPVHSGEGEATDLVGIDDSKAELIKRLNIDAEQMLVVSIQGPPGVGKTTLAKQVYREVEGQFECRAFVRASKMPDTRMLLSNIISQIQCRHQGPPHGLPVQELIDSLRKHLQHKRYLIVIDGLWETTSWDIVSSAFPDDAHCSRILITTDIEEVALECCDYESDAIFKMEPLGGNHSSELFFNRVFGFKHDCSKQLKESSEEIIRTCGGLPLAIISIASILAIQPDNLELWRHVKEALFSRLRYNLTSEVMLREIVGLSYNSLPRHLKTCLLYLSMYPEGYTFLKADLVNQWTAEGFIIAVEDKNCDEVAECYFDELTCRGLIQPNHTNISDEVTLYTLHSNVFEVIRSMSIEENFSTVIDYSNTISELSVKVRRLSLRFSSAKYATKPETITLSPVRSLIFYGLVKCLPSIMEFEVLRVLILDVWGDHDQEELDLSGIDRLFQLRYMRITSNIIVKLPARVIGLPFLQTMEIYAKVTSVPTDIIHLPRLVHLCVRGEINLSKGIGHMGSLRTLQSFDLSSNSEDDIRQLGEMTDLRDLHVISPTEMSDPLKGKLIAFISSLEKLGNLKSIILELAPATSCTSIYLDCSWSISSMSIFLQRLELLPPICIFSRLPVWIGQLQKLCILKIVLRELTTGDVDSIAKLQELTILSLYVRQPTAEQIVFHRAAFPVLKFFKFRCGIMRIAFQPEAMPRLRSLNLEFNAHTGEQNGNTLGGIEHLLNLREITGRIGAAPGAEESDRIAVESVFKDAISKHSRFINFNLRIVGLFDEEWHKKSELDEVAAVVEEASPPAQAQPEPLAQQPPAPHLAWLSRYESQKRRDWNTFLQYLRNHRPPLTLARCSGVHVIKFLRYLDQFGKTKVHAEGCAYFGQPNPPAPCACPLRQAWESLDALIGRLGAVYEESGGRRESNPFKARAVHLYLREVRTSETKARIHYEKKKRKRGSTAAPPVAPAPVVTAETAGTTSGAGGEEEDDEPSSSAGELGQRQREVATFAGGPTSPGIPAPTAAVVQQQQPPPLAELERVRRVSSGPGGTVWMVRHRGTGQLYALKVLYWNLDDAVRRQIAREIAILSTAEHPALVRCHGMYEHSGELQILLEYMDGGSLDGRRIAAESFLADVARQVLSGIAYLHRRHIVHRDIKPSNFLIDSSRRVKIADFGVGRILNQTMDPSNSSVGTIAYMSPEQINTGLKDGSYAGDIWSFGLSILELYLGRFPFGENLGKQGDWAKLMCAICYSDPLEPPPTASPEFRGFISCCLWKNPAKRPTAAQLLQHPFVAGPQPQPPAAPPPS